MSFRVRAVTQIQLPVSQASSTSSGEGRKPSSVSAESEEQLVHSDGDWIIIERGFDPKRDGHLYTK